VEINCCCSSFFLKSDCTNVKNYRPISILILFSEIFEFIIHNHLSNFFKHRLNPAQHNFRKFNSTTTNLKSVMPSVCTQGQVHSVYFYLNSALTSFPITFFSIRLVILNPLPVMLIGFIAAFVIDIPLYVFLVRFRSLSL
jgi:hypothetical protein